MQILWDRRRKDIQITERLMELIADRSGYDHGMSNLIIRNLGVTVPLNKKIIASFAERAPLKIMELLLEIRGDEIEVTEELLIIAADNWTISEVFLLWESSPGIQVTSNLLLEIAFRSRGLEYMEFILKKCHQGYALDHELLEKVVANSRFGLSMMRMLLEKRHEGLVVFDISEETMMAAASNGGNPEQMMDLLINNETNSEVLISEKVLCSAAGNQARAESALKYLLKFHETLPITEKVMVSIAVNVSQSEKVLPLLMERGHNLQGVARLLEQDVLSLLLEKGLLEIDNNLVDAVGIQRSLMIALQHPKLMEKLLGLPRNDITVDEEIILRALMEVRVVGEAFQMLTDRLGTTVPITEKILEIALLNNQSGLWNCLLKEGKTLSSEFLRVGADWAALFNPAMQRSLDVKLVHHLPHQSAVTCLAFSRDGKYLATGGNKSLQIFALATGSLVSTLVDGIQSIDEQNAEDEFIRVWDVSSRKIKYILTGHTAEIYSIDTDPSGRYLASGGEDQTIRLWDMIAGQLINAISVEDGLYSVSFSPDGLYLAVGGRNNEIWVFEMPKGYLIANLKGHYREVCSICFTPDSRRLYSASLDNAIKLWELESGRCIQTYRGRQDFTITVSTTPEGTWLMSDSMDCCFRFRDPDTGDVQMVVNGHESRVMSIRSCPVGNMFATAGEDKRARVWKYLPYKQDA